MRNPATMDIDARTISEILVIINKEDQRVAGAIKRELPYIAKAVEMIVKPFRSEGRLFYVGAGTSGRLGVLDAVECPPTFGVSDDLVQAWVVGGSDALTQSAVGDEDDSDSGARDMKSRSLPSRDVVIGISSGSTAAYVRGALE